MPESHDDGEALWREFRAAREAELAEPHGWLCLTGFHWLPAEPAALPGLPGLWWADDEGGHCQVTPDEDDRSGDRLLLDGQPLDGRSDCTTQPLGRVPWLTLGDTSIELLNREHRFAIRLRAATSPARETFTGVPTYPYDPAWVITGQFHPYAVERPLLVGTCRSELSQTLRAVGEVEFATPDGSPQRLIATTIKAGMGVEFHDPSNGVETPAWRQLKFAMPDADGRVVLDFNRTINMWFAFTPHATCPKPFEGQSISAPVAAGERLP